LSLAMAFKSCDEYVITASSITIITPPMSALRDLIVAAAVAARHMP